MDWLIRLSAFDSLIKSLPMLRAFVAGSLKPLSNKLLLSYYCLLYTT